ncbi:hypothetical protein S40293_08367 [Stachybotrys chartarum IBT 40293]|nr:hypothetical protein S40293_08367 [Stachybotrys chartarum IBT 40293]
MEDTEYTAREERDTARYGIFTGTVSVMRDLGDTISWAWKKVEEFQAFDRETSLLLIRFSREITRVEIWCQSMGYALDPSNGIIRQDASIGQHLLNKKETQTASFVESTVSSSQALIKRIIIAFQRIGHADLQKFQTFNTRIVERTVDTTVTAGRDLEMGSFTRPLTYESMMQALRLEGLVRQPLDASDKVLEMFKGTLHGIDQDLKELHEHNNNLQRLRMTTQLDELSTVVPAGFASVQQSVDKLVTLFDSASEADRALQIACLNSLLSMDHMDLGRLSDYLETREVYEFDLDDLKDQPSYRDNARGLVCYDSNIFLIEWNNSIKADRDEKRRQIKERLENLVYRLEIQDVQYFSLLCPIAYTELIDDEDARYGLLYKLPNGFDPRYDVVRSLKDIFMRMADEPDCAPALGQKFLLAAKLTKILRQFQTSQWLHQSFNPEHILFIEPRVGQCTLAKPLITGFNFSRYVTSDSDERKPQTLEGDHYQHPFRRQRSTNGLAEYRYRGEFDIYSLGRVLLDISQWKVVGDDDFSRAVAELPSKMGEIYARAVKWCLGLDPTSLIRESRLRDFKDEANAPLGWSADLIYAYDKNVRTKMIGVWV